MKNIKMILSVLVLLSVLTLMACDISVDNGNNNVTVERVEPEAYTFERAYVLDNFEVDRLLIRVYFSDDTWHFLPLNNSMLSVSDQNKLGEVGEHELDVYYRGFNFNATVTIVESEQALWFYQMYQVGLDIPQDDFFTWFDSLVLDEVTTIEDIYVDENNTLFVVLSDARILEAGTLSFDETFTTVSYEEGELVVTYASGDVDRYMIDTESRVRATFITDDNRFIDVRYVVGTTVSAPTPLNREGYTFTHWSQNLETITTDTVVVGHYEADTFTLSFNANGGTSISSAQYNTDEPITVPAPTRSGYLFAGWFKNSDLSIAMSNDVMPAHDLTLYAAWMPLNQDTTDSTQILDTLDASLESIIGISNQKTDGTQGTGTGMIYKHEAGTYFVVTNEHVIRDYESLEIVYERYGRLYQISGTITVLGVDPTSDTAVLTFTSSESFPVVTFADSSLLRKGETVYALGHPRGLNYFNSVTKGIVSNLQREVGHENIDVLLVQTDATINPGNSGGALVNTLGEVVGMNTLKLTGDNVDNQGFAVPSNTVQKVISDLEIYGELKATRLGISVNQEPSSCGVEYGVCITEVSANSTASAMNLQAGDAVIGYTRDGSQSIRVIYNFKDLRDELVSTPVGTLIALEIIRNGTTFQTSYEVLQARN